MANGAFSLGLADPNAILQQLYQQQQMQQPGAFGIPGAGAQPDYSQVDAYVQQLAERRASMGKNRKPVGQTSLGEGLDTPLQEPRYAFGRIIEDPRAAPRRQALLEVNKELEGKEGVTESDIWTSVAEKLRRKGDIGGALIAVNTASGLRAAESRATPVREYAYKAGETKEFDLTLPTGKVGTQSAQFWPELAEQGYQHSPELPIGFIPVTGTAVPRKEPMGVSVNIGKDVAKEAAKLTFDELGQANKEAKAARSGIASINFINQALEGLNTGSLAPVQLYLGKAASSFGVRVGDISSMEAAEGATGNLVMSVLDNFPGAISEGERAYAKSIVPSLTTSPEGRKQLSTFMNSMFQRAIEYRKQMDAFRAKSPDGTLYPPGRESFQSTWDEYSAKNPVTAVFGPAKGSRRPIDTSKASKAFKDTSGNIWYEMDGKIVNQFGEERK